MKVRRLTEKGIDDFGKYLDQLSVDSATKPPLALLDGNDASPVVDAREIEDRSFADKYEFAEYLDSVLPDGDLRGDVGLWSWLSLFFFSQLCPAGPDGKRKPRERARYIPEPDNFQRYYRHLVLGPFLIYRTHRDQPRRAMAFLCRELNVVDEVVAQLAAQVEFVRNRAVVELATELYYDPKRGTTKKGAQSKTGGSPRRLVDVLLQFDVTRDLFAMTLPEIRGLLPSEFDRFRA